jgi:hypothetical protein
MEQGGGGAGGPGAIGTGLGRRLALRAIVGGTPEIEIGGRRFRLSQEKVFRLEEVDGGFVYYLRSAGAVERRLAQIAIEHPGPAREIPGPWSEAPPDN